MIRSDAVIIHKLLALGSDTPESFRQRLAQQVAVCDSFLEVYVLISFLQAWRIADVDAHPMHVASLDEPRAHLLQQVEVGPDKRDTPLVPRHLDVCGRIDFVVIGQGMRAIAIECDGLTYHERNPEQVERDRVRDAALHAKGWHVLRFTAPEIQQHPRIVVDAVEALLKTP